MFNMLIQVALWPLGIITLFFFACAASDSLRKFSNEIVKDNPEAVSASQFFIGVIAGSITLAILILISGG